MLNYSSITEDLGSSQHTQFYGCQQWPWERTSRTPLKQFHCICNIKLGPPQAPVGCVPGFPSGVRALSLSDDSVLLVVLQGRFSYRSKSLLWRVCGALRMHSVRLGRSPYHLGSGQAHTVSGLLVNPTLWFPGALSLSHFVFHPFVNHLKDRAASLLSPVCQGSCIFFKIEPQVDLGLARPQLLSPLGPFWVPLTWYQPIF